MTSEFCNLKRNAIEILSELAGFKATSYWEDGPVGYLADRAAASGLEVEIDEWGNALVTRHGTDGAKPGIGFVAHTDHPGYEVVEQEGENITLHALGGISLAAGRRGARILVIAESGEEMSATITKAKPASGQFAQSRESDGWLGTDTVFAKLDSRESVGELPRPAVLDLPDFAVDDGLIKMRAADDLAGCAAILATLEQLTDESVKGTVYGLFTRAEEVGLIGARLAAANKSFPEETIVISVETSAELPGAEIGKGVVIRTGDRTATFDYEAEMFLVEAANKIKSVNPEFRVQRQLMSAGGCEASAFKAFGYRVTGTAFPLGAWHNRGTKGVESEYISTGDFVGGVMLLSETAKLAGTPQLRAAPDLSLEPYEQAERLRKNRKR